MPFPTTDPRDGSLVLERPHPSDRARRIGARGLLLFAVVAALVGGPTLVASTAPAAAVESSTTTPPAEETTSAPPSSETPDSETPTAGPPTLTVDTPPSPVRLPQIISGTRSSGAEVQVQGDDGSGQPLCIAPASDSTDWSCVVSSLPSGPAVPLRVVALADSLTSDQRLTVAWLNAPTLVAAEKATTAGQVGGRGHPGATVTASLDGEGSSCSVPVDSSGSWTCVLSEPLPSGSYTATAVQETDFSGGPSAASPSATVLIDKDPPPVPRLLTPADGSTQPLAGSIVSGEGEDGNSVIVFAGARPLCQAEVRGGTWSCRAAAVPAGTYSVNALQMDAAGNASSASASVSVEFTDSSATPTPSPGGSSTAPGTGSTTPGGVGGSPSDGGSVPSPQKPDGASPAPDASGSRPDSGGGFASRWWQSMQTPTALGTSLAPLDSVQAPQLVLATGLAAGTVALIIVPVLLARRALRGRLARIPSLTGRNRMRDGLVSPTAPSVDRWTRAVFGTATAAGLLTLSMPVLAQSNYLRLAVAAALAIALLNLLGTVAVVRVARRFFDVEVITVTHLPLLGVTALTALASRLFGLAPPLVAGQILGARFADSVPPRQRSAVALSQIVVAASLTVSGWAVYSAFPATGSTVQLFASEAAGVLTLTSATTAPLAALPFGFLPGAHLLRRSRMLWLATTTLTWSLLFLVLTAVAPGHTAPAITAMVAVAVGFSAVASAVWIWTRYVEPFLRTS